MKMLIPLLLALSSLNAMAIETENMSKRNVFHREERWGDAYQGRHKIPCAYARGSCNEDSIELELQELCLRSFKYCETTFKKKYVLKEGSDMFCGQWRSGKCSVTVIGTDEN